MGELSLLDLAAEVRAKAKQVDSVCADVRRANGDWTGHGLAADEASSFAVTALRHAWQMLDRIQRLADDELKRIKAQPPTLPSSEVGRDE